MSIINGAPNKVILVKPNMMKESELVRHYGPDFFALPVPDTGTGRKDMVQDMCEQFSPSTVKCILCADSDMFKTLTGVKKVSGYDGEPVESKVNQIPAFIIPNYFSLLYNPEQGVRMAFIMGKIKDFLEGKYTPIAKVITHAEYPQNTKEIGLALYALSQSEVLTCDIETAPTGLFNLSIDDEKRFKGGLHHYSNMLYSIAFGTNEHGGFAFIVNGNREIRNLLRDFFTNYQGKLIFHNASFDITQLIYHLFMNSLEDYENMLKGLHIMCRNIEDTYLIAYLCLNSCSHVELSLKTLSHQFTGRYAVDVDDCTKLPVNELLEYNLTDCCATYWVYNQYLPRLKSENQEEIYRNLFLPSLKTLIETQLVGMRIYPQRLEALSRSLNAKYDDWYIRIMQHPLIEEVIKIKSADYVKHYNATHKKQILEPNVSITFNPGSDSDLITLLYNLLKLPVLETTDKGQPSCRASVLEDLRKHTQDESTLNLLDNLINLAGVQKIISSFIPSFERTLVLNDMKALFGMFNLGGTISGRLSSSNPNLQQIPSTGSIYAKPVKQIFGAPKGYIFAGADQRSLEDRISALTTKDPNKLSVYTDGYDGHCLRAFHYFRDQMPDIELAEPTSMCARVIMDDGTEVYMKDKELQQFQDEQKRLRLLERRNQKE